MDPSFSSTDEQYEAGSKGDAQVDGTDIDNPGEDYIKTSKEPKEPEPEGSAGDFKNEDEDEDTSSGDDTVVNATDSEEESFEDSRNDNTEEFDVKKEKQGQAGVDEQQEYDASGDEATYVDSIEEIEPGQEHPVQSRDEPTQRSEVDVLQRSFASIDEGESHIDEKADISQEHVEAYVQSLIASAHEIVADELEIENVSQSYQYPSCPVEDDVINDTSADNPPDEPKTVFGDFDTDTMGEGASKLEPQNLSEHPLIPADISDLTAGEAKGPTGDKIIIIDYKKRRQEQEATNNPSSLDADEETDDIDVRQNDSLASDPCEALKYESRDSVDDEDTSFAQMQEQPVLLEKSPESDRREETEIVFDGSLASHPNDLPIDEDQGPTSFTVGDIFADNELETQNIERTTLYHPHSAEGLASSAANTNIQSGSYEGEGDEFTTVVSESDRTAHLKDEASSYVGMDNEPIVQEGNAFNDSNDMSEDKDIQTGESQKELEVLVGEIPLTNTYADVAEDDSFAKSEDGAQEEEEMEGSPADSISDDGDYRLTAESFEKEGEFDKVEEVMDLPIAASCEQVSFAENLDGNRKIENDGAEFETDKIVEVLDMKSDDDTTEDDTILVLETGDGNNLAEPVRDDSDVISANDALGKESESENENEKGDSPMFTSGDETLTANLESENDSDDISEDVDNQSEEHRNDLEVLGGEIPLTNPDVDVAGDYALANLDTVQEGEEMEGSPAEATTDGDEYRSTDESVRKEGKFDGVEMEIDMPTSAACEQASFPGNLAIGGEIENDETNIQNENLVDVVDMKSEDNSTEEGAILMLDSGNDNSMTEPIPDESEQRSANDPLGEEDESVKEDTREDLPMFTLGDETSTGNVKSISHDASEDEIIDNSNDLDSVGHQEGVEEREATPISVKEDESTKKDDSMFPVDFSEDGTANNEMSLSEAIEVNNLYLSKPTNYPEEKFEEFPVTNISEELETNEDKHDKEACDAAYGSVERSDDDSIASGHIASDVEDAIESEKLAKDLEEKRIEEMLRTSPEQQQSLEEFISNEDNATENDDEWESTGSASTSTTPSIDYKEDEEDQDVLEVDDNTLESKPYGENDIDDNLVEEAVTFQENVSFESSGFKNLLNQLNGSSYENSEGISPRRTYTDEEVRKAIQILTSRPPYDKKDVDYENFYKGMSRAETLRVFALVLAPNQQESKERVFGIFANPEDVSHDNRYIGDEEKIAPTVTDNSLDLSDIIAGLEQPILVDTSEDVETCPDSQPDESRILDLQKHESEDDETESSSSASSGMYVVDDYPGIVDDERSQLVMVDEHVSIPVSRFDDEYQESDVSLYGGKFFCVTRRFAKSFDGTDLTDKVGSESAPIQAFSDIPPNVGRPLPTHKTPLGWIDPEESKDIKTLLQKDSHQPSEGEVPFDTETRILHLSDDKAEYDMYLYHQPTEHDAGNVDQEDGVQYNAYHDHDSRENLELRPSEFEDAIIPTTHDTKPCFRPQDMGDGEWEKVDSPKKLHDIKEFDFNPLEVKHLTFEESVLPIDHDLTGVCEYDIVPEVLEPIESSDIKFDFDEAPETHDITDPAILLTTSNTLQNNNGLGKQERLDDITDSFKASEVGQESDFEEFIPPGQGDVANYNVYLDHDSREDTEGGQEPKVEDAIVPTTHDAKSVFKPQDMGDGDWEKVDNSGEINSGKKVDFFPPEVKHRSFEENILPIDHDSGTVHENDIVPEFLEPIENVQVNFDFDEPPETHVITESPVLVTTIKLKSQKNNDVADKSQLLDDITDIIDNDVFEENEETESIESNPPHFCDEYEPLPENMDASKYQKDERPSSITDLLRDVGITDDGDVLGGSAFVVVGTPSEHVTRDNMKVSEIEVDETLPLQSDILTAEQEKTTKVDCDDTLDGNHHGSSSSSSSSSSSASDANDSSEKEEFPYESLDNEIDGYDNKNDAEYVPSLALSLQQLSSSSSSYEDDDHLDVGLNHSDRTDSGRRSSSSSSCSSNNTAQEPDVPERVDTDQAPEKHGLLADNHDITADEAAEYFSFNSSIDGPTDVTVIRIDKENDDLDHISDDFQVQALLSGDPIVEEEDHGINEGSDETDVYSNDRHNPIAEITDVAMDVYLETVPSVDETLRSTDTPHDCKPEEDNSFHIPTKTPDNEQDSWPVVEETVPPVSFNMYLDTAPLDESPVEIDTYLEHVPKLESGREADVGVISTSDSDDITPPRGRVESSSPASAFSDSDVGEDPASSQSSIIFAVYGKVSETEKPDEKPMVVAIHQNQKSFSSHDLQEDDERSYEFQGSVEVFREEELGEIHKRSVTSFVEISRSSRQPIDPMNIVPDLDITHDDHAK